MAQATQANGCSVDSWRAFWADPHAARALVRVPTVVTDDVVGVGHTRRGRFAASRSIHNA